MINFNDQNKAFPKLRLTGKCVFRPAIFVVLLTIVLSRDLCAQSTLKFVVPGGTENVEGNSQTSFGGNPQVAARHQQFITPAAIPTLPDEGVMLTDVSFRLNVSPDPTGGGGVENFDNVDVSLSSTTRPVSPNLD